MLSRNDAGLEPSRGLRWRDAALIAYGRAFEHPSKIRMVRWLARRLAGDRVLVRYAPGAVIAIDPADYIGWAVFKTGHYEPASLSLALRIMREAPGLFVDVGAHTGWYSCAVAAISGARVVSIEPECENCASLRNNIALNQLHDIIVVNIAVGSECGMGRIGRRSPRNSGTVAVSTDERADSTDAWVAMTPLEMLLARVVEPPARPTLVKIDVEGFEREVLRGLDFSGPFRPRNILMEFTPVFASRSWASFGDLKAFFAEAEYDLLDVFGAPLQSGSAIPEENVWARERR